jgi:hypothetical protein
MVCGGCTVGKQGDADCYGNTDHDDAKDDEQ